MDRPPNDTDAEALVQRSLLFRLARQLFVSIDAAAERSTLLPARTTLFSVASTGRLVMVASVAHAGLVTVIPMQQAPLGRYSLGAAGLFAGLALELFTRATSKAPEAPAAPEAL